jgi:hypothetical protein
LSCLALSLRLLYNSVDSNPEYSLVTEYFTEKILNSSSHESLTTVWQL